MFTGIIEEIGKIQSFVRKADRQELTVRAKTLSLQMKIGDSIAVNGVCFTVTDRVMNDFKVEVVPETLSKTSVSDLKIGDIVNLERAMKAEGRFDGHIVTGHVDSKSTILDIQTSNNGLLFEIVTPDTFSKYVVNRGSISVDGISLTIAKVNRRSFVAAIIHHTYDNTNLKQKKVGSIVNLEFDLFGKYVEKILVDKKIDDWQGVTKEKIDWDFMKRTGFLN